MHMETEKFILVTGGAGYIGSHTVAALCNIGYTPVILDDLRNAKNSVIDNLETITKKPIIHYRLDCSVQVNLDLLFDKFKFDAIIHFAAYKAVGESVTEPLKYYQNNLSSLLNVLAYAEKFDVKNIVFSSSCTVYGEPKGTKIVSEENEIMKASSPYGETKIMCEQILNDYSKANQNAKVVCLRYFNPIGAHDSALIGELPLGTPNNLLPYITQTAIGKLDQLTVFGDDYQTEDGTCVRDYIHVVDLADAHVAACDFALGSKKGFVKAINIGTGNGTSVLQAIKMFEQVTGVKLNYKIGARRPGDVEAIYANAAKAKKLLNWEAKHDLKSAISSAWKWEQNLAKNV
jgi:UDP-glucose 4-epimerase